MIKKSKKRQNPFVYEGYDDSIIWNNLSRQIRNNKPWQGSCWETNCRNNHNFGHNYYNNYGAITDNYGNFFQKKQTEAYRFVLENNEQELE